VQRSLGRTKFRAARQSTTQCQEKGVAEVIPSKRGHSVAYLSFHTR
jgi:hypothetical protein